MAPNLNSAEKGLAYRTNVSLQSAPSAMANCTVQVEENLRQRLFGFLAEEMNMVNEAFVQFSKAEDEEALEKKASQLYARLVVRRAWDPRLLDLVSAPLRDIDPTLTSGRSVRAPAQATLKRIQSTPGRSFAIAPFYQSSSIRPSTADSQLGRSGE